MSFRILQKRRELRLLGERSEYQPIAPSNDPVQASPPERTPLNGAPPQKSSHGGFISTAMGAAKTSLKDPSGQGAALGRDLIKGGDAKSGLGQMLGWDKSTKAIDRIQDVVDVIGIVDPTGVADAANAVGYAARGEWGSAAASVAGLIPVVGDAFGKGAKYGGRLAKAGSKAAHLEKAAAHVVEKRAGKFAKAKKVISQGKEAYDRTKGAYDKIQARKQARGQGAPLPGPDADGPPPRTPLVSPAAAQPAAQQVAPAQAPGLMNRAQGVYNKFQSARGSEAGQAVEKHARAWAGKAAQGQTSPAAGSGAGSSGGAIRGGGKATEVPIDGDCPGANTKTSTFRASPGKKRCSPQTPGRDHGDD